jgi:hypothetical protein
LSNFIPLDEIIINKTKKMIVFKSKDGNSIVTFSEFEFQTDVIHHVYFNIKLNFDFFNASTRLDAEEYDFIDMKECLIKMLEKKQPRAFYFKPMDLYLVIFFNLLENGDLFTTLELSNPMFKGQFKCEFIIDNSYIPELISQIDIVIDRKNNQSNDSDVLIQK